VDNHFDKLDMNGEYHITWRNGEEFEGKCIDGKRHGYGKFRFHDGSIYRGDWFQDKRQGTGELKSPDGSFYTGEWDNDQIHGEGFFFWAKDKSSYTGETIRGVRSGRGVYKDTSGNIYDGCFRNSQMDGKGIFMYVNGDKYEGPFRENKREGRALFTKKNGEVHIGEWKNDIRDGIFIIKRENINNGGAVEKEVLVSRWKEGKCVAWEESLVDPKITARFYERWANGEEQLNSTYAADVARKLPFLPRGVDGSQPFIQRILRQIAQKNIEAICADTYRETKEMLSVKSKEVATSRAACLQLERKIVKLCSVMTKHNESLNVIQNCCDEINLQIQDVTRSIAIFWEGDGSRARQAFAVACEELKKINAKDWFKLRRYHEPPQFIAKLLSAVCNIMQVDDSWEMSKILLGSSKNNRDKGDEDSIWQQYDVKLLFLLYGKHLRKDTKNNSLCDQPSQGQESIFEGVGKSQDQRSGTNSGPLPTEYDLSCIIEKQAVLLKVSAFFHDPITRNHGYIINTFGHACLALVAFVKASGNYIKKVCSIEAKNIELTELENLVKHKCSVLDDAKRVFDSFVAREEDLTKELQVAINRRDTKTEEEEKLDCTMTKCLRLMTSDIRQMACLSINSDDLICDSMV